MVGAARRLHEQPGRDLQIIEKSPQLARLHGVKQAFLFPIAGPRSRRDHCVEVAQIAAQIAENSGLDADLARAGGLGYDCGHAPGGHAGEGVSVYMRGVSTTPDGAPTSASPAPGYRRRASMPSATTRGRTRVRRQLRARWWD